MGQKKVGFSVRKSPTSCRWLCVTFMGRTSTLPTILHGKGLKVLETTKTFWEKSCEKGQSVPRSRTEKGGNLDFPHYETIIRLQGPNQRAFPVKAWRN